LIGQALHQFGSHPAEVENLLKYFGSPEVDRTHAIASYARWFMNGVFEVAQDAVAPLECHTPHAGGTTGDKNPMVKFQPRRSP